MQTVLFSLASYIIQQRCIIRKRTGMSRDTIEPSVQASDAALRNIEKIKKPLWECLDPCKTCRSTVWHSKRFLVCFLVVGNLDLHYTNWHHSFWQRLFWNVLENIVSKVASRFWYLWAKTYYFESFAQQLYWNMYGFWLKVETPYPSCDLAYIYIYSCWPHPTPRNVALCGEQCQQTFKSKFSFITRIQRPATYYFYREQRCQDIYTHWVRSACIDLGSFLHMGCDIPHW